MTRSSALAGIIGLVCLTFGVVDYLIAPGFRLFVVLNIAVGGFALLMWASSGREAIGAVFGGRTARYGTNAAVYTVAFVLILAAVNFLAARHEHRFDLTSERIYSLSPQSLKVVKSLKKPLKFYGFFEGGTNERALELYQMYAYASPRIKYELVDPDRHPELAEKFKVSVMGTTHLQYGGENGRGTNVTELSEQALTNAIVKVTRDTSRTICVSEGHGELDPDDAEGGRGFSEARQALEGEGYTVKKILLASQEKVPAECNALIVAGVQKPLLAHELEEIDNYVKAGGSVEILLTPPHPGADKAIVDADPKLTKLVERYGVKPGNDVVVDQVVRLFAGPALGLSPIVQKYGKHPITEGFTQRTVFPMTRSMTPVDIVTPGIHVTALARTSDSSWAESNLQELFNQQKAGLDSDDKRGPIVVCDAVEANPKEIGGSVEGEAKLVVCGSAEFADNKHLNDFYNRDFFVNSVDWLVGESNAISIRPRHLRASRFRLTVGQYSLVFALSVLMLPELLLLTGLIVWWQRRL